jgi:hypothetical protein
MNNRNKIYTAMLQLYFFIDNSMFIAAYNHLSDIPYIFNIYRGF